MRLHNNLIKSWRWWIYLCTRITSKQPFTVFHLGLQIIVWFLWTAGFLRHPPAHMTQHYLNLCCSFMIVTITVFTKIDSCPEHALKISKEELGKMMHSPKVSRRPFSILNEQNITTCVRKLQTLAQIFEPSWISREGLSLLRKMLFALQKRRYQETLIICSSFSSKLFSIEPVWLQSYQALLCVEWWWMRISFWQRSFHLSWLHPYPSLLYFDPPHNYGN